MKLMVVKVLELLEVCYRDCCFKKTTLLNQQERTTPSFLKLFRQAHPFPPNNVTLDDGFRS